MVHKIKKEHLERLRQMDERQKWYILSGLLSDKWGVGKPVMYKGRTYFVSRIGGQYVLMTKKVYNLPETATYTLGKGAFTIAENDRDVSQWEMSKEILLRDNYGFGR